MPFVTCECEGDCRDPWHVRWPRAGDPMPVLPPPRPVDVAPPMWPFWLVVTAVILGAGVSVMLCGR
jgi:hypothetical protein